MLYFILHKQVYFKIIPTGASGHPAVLFRTRKKTFTFAVSSNKWIISNLFCESGQIANVNRVLVETFKFCKHDGSQRFRS